MRRSISPLPRTRFSRSSPDNSVSQHADLIDVHFDEITRLHGAHACGCAGGYDVTGFECERGRDVLDERWDAEDERASVGVLLEAPIQVCSEAKRTWVNATGDAWTERRKTVKAFGACPLIIGPL
jgi:hypothetical protein